MGSISLPPEIWLYIHRFASSPSLLMAARSEELAYVSSQDPFQTISLREARCFVLVSRLWNSLARELLYENIPVPDNPRWFEGLRTALEHPGTAALVRSIQLTTFRGDHNAAVLALCTQVQVVSHPGDNSGSTLIHPSSTISFPTFHSLKHVFWTESIMSFPPLRLLLESAPNVEHLLLQLPPHFELRQEERWTLPALPRLQRLACLVFTNHPVFKLDLQHLVRLHCASLHMKQPDFPALPALETLELFGSYQGIDFSYIFSRFPRLRQLLYDVWNSIVAPPALGHPPHAELDQVRLHSSVTVVRNWRPIEEHFALLISPEFPRIKRVVLEGMWYNVVSDVRFAHFRDGLGARGCQVEFPEGFVRR